jgi:hypothetical protein
MNRGLREISRRAARTICHLRLALPILAVVVTSTAYAKAADPLERQIAEARKACLTGDYQKGIDILSDLFIKTKGANYIYNQGRCLEQNARYEDAVLRFEEYLRLTKGSDSKERGEADEHIAECQAKIAKAAAVSPPPVPPPIGVEQPVQPEPKPVTIVEQPESTASSPGRRLRIAGITAGALGVASLVTAVVLNVKANSMADELNKPTGYDRGKVSQQSNYKTGSWVGYGVGSACLVGGAILYYLGSSSEGSNAVALLPVLAPDQAGVALRGGF